MPSRPSHWSLSGRSPNTPAHQLRTPQAWAASRQPWPNIAEPISGELASAIAPDAFYELVYSGVLKQLVARVLESEVPVSEAMLVQRIAGAHGFQRSGRLIRNRVMMAAEHGRHMSEEQGACFVWQSAGQASAWRAARRPASDSDVRQIEDIALEELRAAALLGDATEIARFFGVKRLSAGARRRIVQAVS